MIFKQSYSIQLGLLAALFGGITAAPVHAQDVEETVFPGKFLMEMLPAGQIVGDGQTPVTLYVTALDSAGYALKTSRLKMTASEGSISGLENRGDGLIEMQFVPPQVRESQEIILRMKGKIGSNPLIQAWSIQVVPEIGSTMQAILNPPQVILGQDRTASIRFSLTNSSDYAGAPDLQIRATAGSISNTTYLGNGQFSALYTPPDVVYPHTALITVSDKRAPTETYGYLAVPLVGKTDFPRRNLAANASVILRIAGREFGPYSTDENGSVSIPVIVPPGIAKGTQIVVANGRTTETSIDLKVPATRRISLMPVHDGIPGDGVHSITLRAVVIQPTGEADPTAAVRFTASSGEVSATRHEGNGIYAVTYKPPTKLRPTSASIKVSLDGESGIQSDSFDIQLVPARPTSLKLTPDPAIIAPRGEGFKLFAKIRGEDGSGLSGRSITTFANGAQLRGSVKDLGNGDYEAAFVTTGRNHVDITATAMPTATGNPLRGVIVFSSKARLPNDGLSSSLITIVAVDEFGYPVPGVPVDLSVLGDLGNLPDSVTTDSQGLAQVFYTAGRQAGIAHILAKAGAFSSGAAIFQAPQATSPGMVLPMGGSAYHRARNSAWVGIVTQVRVEREGAEAPTVATIADPTMVVSLQVNAQPQVAAPGGTVVMTIDARNADSRGVPGQALDVMASQGTISPIRDNGDGTYSASLTLGQSAKGDTKIVVSTQDGTLFQMMRIATVDGFVPDSPVEPIVAPEPVVEPTPQPDPVELTPTPTASSTSGEAKWLRIRGGILMGQYTSLQDPVSTVKDNPLYSGTIALNNAGMVGGDFGVNAWIPELPWLGFDADVKVGSYTAGWPAAELGAEATEIPDFIPFVSTHLQARYAFSESEFNFYVAGKAGFLFSDLLRYTWKPGSQTTVEYKALNASGFSSGVELGGDTMNGDLFFSAGFTSGFVGLSPYASLVDLEIGYTLLPNVFASVNFNQFSRRIEIGHIATSTTLGTLSDSGWSLSTGVGFEY